MAWYSLLRSYRNFQADCYLQFRIRPSGGMEAGRSSESVVTSYETRSCNPEKHESILPWKNIIPPPQIKLVMIYIEKR
jgi:hypothetical protein